VRGEAAVPKGVPANPDTLRWLLDRYRESSAWASLAPSTRRARDNIFHGLVAKSGDLPYSMLTREVVAAGRESRQATPAMANSFLKAMRGLCRWAAEAQFLAENVAANVRPIAIKSDGHHTWTDDEVSAFEARWPVGTRERLALDLLLYTGLRRGDAVRLGCQHVKAGVFRIKTDKNGVEIAAPILPALARSIAGAATGDLCFISGEHGGRLTKESFGNYFREACIAAGVPGRAHGLRKAGASRAAENGATNEQLKAIFGWTDDKMPSLYTRQASRAKMAGAAMGMLSRDDKS
jgi:integrase